MTIKRILKLGFTDESIDEISNSYKYELLNVNLNVISYTSFNDYEEGYFNIIYCHLNKCLNITTDTLQVLDIIEYLKPKYYFILDCDNRLIGNTVVYGLPFIDIKLKQSNVRLYTNYDDIIFSYKEFNTLTELVNDILFYIELAG